MNKKKVSVTPTRKRHQNINTIKRKLQLSGEILEKKTTAKLGCYIQRKYWNWAYTSILSMM